MKNLTFKRAKKFYAVLSVGIVTCATAIVASPAPGITGTEGVSILGMLLGAGAVFFATNEEI